MIQSPPRTIVEVFESLPEGTLCQVINNELIMSPAPSSRHQQILRDIFRQIDKHVLSNQLGEVLFAPVDVYLDEENVYQPDIVFISNQQIHILQEKINGAPDLIVEILSPGSDKYDKKEKKAVYERSGVKEYWIVDPHTKNTTGYQLQGEHYLEMPAGEGRIQSALLQTTILF
ncbi:MAG TPA: Uma2 family endonuclease [Flavisolibacter sp.]|nr:Uma2 family endonuclease [Flavisolibacter sp.]